MVMILGVSCIINMNKAKLGVSSDGRLMHYSVGAFIKSNDKYFLIDRVSVPLGFASVAGHVDNNEDFDSALVREVNEESGFNVVSYRLLFDEEVNQNNTCKKGVSVHHWRVYECNVSGKFKKNYRETKSTGWYSKEELKNLDLEPVWKYWFENLGVIR